MEAIRVISVLILVLAFISMVLSIDRKSVHFSVLLDVSPTNGPCRPNQVYDPYTKMCRNLLRGPPGNQRIKGKGTKAFPSSLPLPWESAKFNERQTIDVTYEDVRNLGATCDGLDSCRVSRSNEAWKYNCNCDDSCSLLGTCCVDARSRRKYKPRYAKRAECRVLHNNRNFVYPLIKTCDPDMVYDNIAEELCLGRGEYLNDPFLDIQVTDTATGITYENYYCFACNEYSGEERLIPWDVAFGGDLEKVNKTDELPDLQNYKQDWWHWVLDGDNGTEVALFHSLPDILEDTLPFCYAFDIVSECAPNWTDDNIRKMCHAYLALTRIPNGRVPLYYRNPHCAICNYKSTDDMICEIEDEWNDITAEGLIPTGDYFVRLFSLYDKTTIKCDEGMVYDHFSKRCRRLYEGMRKRQDRIPPGQASNTG